MTQILKNTPKKSILKTTFIVYLSIFTCIRIINALHPYFGDLDQDASIRKITLLRLDAIVYGVIIAYFNHFHSTFLKRRRVKNTMLLIGISATILIVVISFLSYLPNFNYYKGSQTYRFLSDSFLYSLLPLSLSFVLPAALFMKMPSNPFKITTIISHISLISYSMYLIHYSLVLTYFQRIHTNSIVISIVTYCGYWLTTILIATLIYYFYEKPTIHLLRGKFVKPLKKNSNARETHSLADV
jgi:peptidoglycan/LPS O-acetylase OafA/YrhL